MGGGCGERGWDGRVFGGDCLFNLGLGGGFDFLLMGVVGEVGFCWCERVSE